MLSEWSIVVYKEVSYAGALELVPKIYKLGDLFLVV